MCHYINTHILQRQRVLLLYVMFALNIVFTGIDFVYFIIVSLPSSYAPAAIYTDTDTHRVLLLGTVSVFTIAFTAVYLSCRLLSSWVLYYHRGSYLTRSCTNWIFHRYTFLYSLYAQLCLHSLYLCSLPVPIVLFLLLHAFQKTIPSVCARGHTQCGIKAYSFIAPPKASYWTKWQS